jgi:hypoxia up-regulated 1
MAKLLKDAQRIKTVLSANTETTAQIEGLFEEVDFRCKVTRETMETLAKDLYPRVAQPLLTAVAGAGLEMKDIETVIIVGGGVRWVEVGENGRLCTLRPLPMAAAI